MKLTRNKLSKILKTKNQSYKKFNKNNKKCECFTIKKNKNKNFLNITPKKIKSYHYIIGGGLADDYKNQLNLLNAALKKQKNENLSFQEISKIIKESNDFILMNKPHKDNPEQLRINNLITELRGKIALLKERELKSNTKKELKPYKRELSSPSTQISPSLETSETSQQNREQDYKKFIDEKNAEIQSINAKKRQEYNERQESIKIEMLKYLDQSKMIAFKLVNNLITKLPKGPIYSKESIPSQYLNIEDEIINLSGNFEKNMPLTQGTPPTLIKTLSFAQFKKKTNLSWNDSVMKEFKSTKTLQDKSIAFKRKITSFYKGGSGLTINCSNLEECANELTSNNILNLTDFLSATFGFVELTGTYQLDLIFNEESQVYKYLSQRISEFRRDPNSGLGENYMNYQLYKDLGIALLSNYKTTNDNIFTKDGEFIKINTSDPNNNTYLIDLTTTDKSYIFGNFIDKKLFSAIIISVPKLISQNKITKNILIKIKLPESFKTLLKSLVINSFIKNETPSKEDLLSKLPACHVPSPSLKGYYSQKMKILNTRDLFIEKVIPPGYVAVAKAYNMGNAFDPALHLALSPSLFEESNKLILLTSMQAVADPSLSINNWNDLASHLGISLENLLNDLLPKLQKISHLPNLTLEQLKIIDPPILGGGLGFCKETYLKNMYGGVMFKMSTDTQKTEIEKYANIIKTIEFINSLFTKLKPIATKINSKVEKKNIDSYIGNLKRYLEICWQICTLISNINNLHLTFGKEGFNKTKIFTNIFGGISIKNCNNLSFYSNLDTIKHVSKSLGPGKDLIKNLTNSLYSNSQEIKKITDQIKTIKQIEVRQALQLKIYELKKTLKMELNNFTSKIKIPSVINEKEIINKFVNKFIIEQLGVFSPGKELSKTLGSSDITPSSAVPTSLEVPPSSAITTSLEVPPSSAIPTSSEIPTSSGVPTSSAVPSSSAVPTSLEVPPSSEDPPSSNPPDYESAMDPKYDLPPPESKLQKWFNFFKNWANKHKDFKIDKESYEVLKKIISLDKNLKGTKLYNAIEKELESQPDASKRIKDLLAKLNKTEQLGGFFKNHIKKDWRIMNSEDKNDLIGNLSESNIVDSLKLSLEKNINYFQSIPTLIYKNA